MRLNTVYEPDGFYFDDELKLNDCKCCKKSESKIEDAAIFLESIIKQLYNRDNLNVLELESDLDELCHLLNVDLIPGDLQIQRLKERGLYVA